MKKGIFALITIILLLGLVGCSSEKKVTLTKGEKKYVEDVYYEIKYVQDVYGPFINSDGKYDMSNSDGEAKLAQIMAADMMEESVDKLPNVPKKYAHYKKDLSKTLSLYSDGIMGEAVQSSTENQDKIRQATKKLNTLDDEVTSLMKQAGLESDMKKAKSDAKDSSKDVVDMMKGNN